MDALELIREGKIHRYFRATRKLNVPNLVSHITQRAAGKEPLFIEDDDRLSILKLLKEMAKKYSQTVYAFCLMPNHIHLLLKPREENLDCAMRDLFSRYAMRFNRKYERRGHLIGGPYRQAVCLDDSYLLASSLYIHLNPARAGMVQNPLHYRWSTCRLYCEKTSPKSFVKPDFVLGLLDDSVAKSKETYKRLLYRGVNLDVEEIMEQGAAIEQFRSGMASLFPSLFRWLAGTHQVSRSLGLELPTIEDLEERMAALRGNAPKKRLESKRAKKYVIEQLLARGYKVTEIAEKLGLSRKTVYNILNS